MNSCKKIASIAGVWFLIGAVTALVSNGLTEPALRASDYLTSMSAHGTQIMIGALVALIEAVASASIAISLYPVLRKYNEGLALGAVGFGLIKAVFYIVNIIGILSLVTVSQEFVRAGAPATSSFQILGTVIQAARAYANYTFGVSAFSLGALMY